MLKARGFSTADEIPVVFLGLSDENWRRLREENQPILCDLAELGVYAKAVIVAGPTEEAIQATLEEWFEVGK